MIDTLPQNLEAEESVLGACLVSPNAIDTCLDILTPADFYRESHSRYYQAILDMHNAGEPVDALTLTARLGDTHKVRVYELGKLVPATANVTHYARIVKETSTRRAMIRFGYEAIKEGQGGGDVDRIEQLAYQIANTAGGDIDLTPGASEYVQTLARLRDNPGELIGVPSGFHALDEITQGFIPGNLIIIGARPSMGKSALALCMSAHLIGQQKPVAVVSLEMSKPEIAQRLLSIGANVPGEKLRNPRKLDEQEWRRVQDAAERLNTLPLYVRETGTATPLEVRALIRRLKAKVPDLACVFVDYLQLLHTGGRHSGDNRVQEVSEISRALKTTARDLGVPVVALSQLSRAVEQRTDKRPVLSDLRESGALEQDADLCIFLFRESYYTGLEPPDGGLDWVECNVAKHRNGPTGLIRLAFKKDEARFTNPAPLRLAGDMGRVA